MYIPETVVFQLKYGAIRNNKMILVRLIVAHIVTSTTDPEQRSEKKTHSRHHQAYNIEKTLTIHADLGMFKSLTFNYTPQNKCYRQTDVGTDYLQIINVHGFCASICRRT